MLEVYPKQAEHFVKLLLAFDVCYHVSDVIPIFKQELLVKKRKKKKERKRIAP